MSFVRDSIGMHRGVRGDRGRHNRPQVERIEGRVLLSVSASPQPLVIHGTSGNDMISVTRDAGGALVATVNGAKTTYTADQYAGGITIDTGNASGAGDTLNIDALPAVAATVKGEGALAVTVGVPGFGERGTQDIAASPLTIEGGPAGTTKLTIDDSGDPIVRMTSLDAFTANGSTYGTVKGLAPGVINFNAANMASVGVNVGQTVANSVIVNSTPGGSGLLGVGNLKSAVVLGTAPGQHLRLFRAMPTPGVGFATVTVDFSTGRIGANTLIETTTEILTVQGSSPTDSFSGLTHDSDGTSIVTDELDIDQVNLSNGTWNGFYSDKLALHVGPAASVTVLPPGEPTVALSIDAGSSVTFAPSTPLDSPAFLVVHGALSIAGKLDLTNNVLETSMPLDQIRALVLQGQGGTSGIISSRADASHNLGYGKDPGGASEVRFTLYGDANLDGKVDFADALALAQNYGKSDASWSQGDFNYDGKVDFSDLLRLSQNYGKSTGFPTAATRKRTRS